ncbi:MAG: FixH family protein [Acetobacteraceae bacterium]|nr:FixH family protein [Acetobacteraceae bacterium]
MNAKTFQPRRGRWIPWVFVGGMALVIAVNGVLIAAAVSTFTGTTVGQAYDRGRTYNHILEEAARQRALGWSAEVAWADGRLTLQARDHTGAPLPADTTITGILLRPLEGTELPLAFQPTGAGTWAAAASVPEPGLWEARLTLTRPDGSRLQVQRRLMLP